MPSDEPSGDPIKVMTVTTLNAAGPTYENIANTANDMPTTSTLAVGSPAGRSRSPSATSSSTRPWRRRAPRQAVEEGMVSIVGSFTFFAESIVPVIAESSITWFGACCPITPSELTNPYSFNIGNQPMYAQ